MKVNNFVPTCKYLWLICKHKCFVFRFGLKTRAPIWRLIIHDWSRFTPAEAPHCGRQFFGAKDDPVGFARAWLHHQHLNPHHWEYWISVTGHCRGSNNDNDALPMPEWAVREMIADWMGAARAYDGVSPPSLQEWGWVQTNWPRISKRLHPVTIERVNMVLREVFSDGLDKATTSAE